MALPQVGLEAIIAGLPGFEAGAKTITRAYDDIEKKAGNVTKASSSLSSSLSSLASPFTSIGQSVLNFGAIAGGAALVGVGALTAGIGALGIAALGEIAKFERMSLSIQNLVAREISQGQEVEQQKQSRIALTAQETEELSKIPQKIQDEELSRKTLAAQIQEQRQRIIDLTASYGDNGLNVQTAKARLAEMENEYTKSGSAIDALNGRMNELNSKNGSLVTTLEKVRVGQMSMNEAMELASPRAQELIKWTQLLGIQSPFTSEGITAALQTALAYGFTSDEAQRLTNAEVDFAAATGKGIEAADQISLALGQMQAKGKVSGQEIIQLTNAGVGVNKILEDMGFTLDDVSAGLVDSDAFIEAVITDMEVFKGAAKDQANTFSGLISSLEEIKNVGLREFFTGTFKAIQPYLADFVGFLTDAAFETGSIKAIGDTIGQAVGGGLAKVAGWIRIISTMGAGGGLSILNEIFGPAAFSLWRELSDLVKNISRSFLGVGTSLRKLMPSFSQLSAIILPAITTALAFVNDHFEEFKGALFGIGTVLGAGVFATITAGLLSLLTPINLIIAGAALLGAAWMGNWGGIRDIVLSAWSYIQPVFDMLQQRAELVIFTFEKFGMSQGFAVLGKQIVAVINMIIPGFADVVTWLQTNIPIAVQTLSDIWTNNLLPGFTRVWEAIETNLIPIFNQLVSWLGTQTPGATQVLADFWNNILLPALAAVGNFLINTLFPAWVETQVWLAQNIPVAIQFLADAWNTILYPALVTVGNWITTTLVPILTDVYNWLYTNIPIAITTLSSLWTDTLLPAITTTADYISTVLTPLMQAMNDFILAVFNKTIQAAAGLWKNVLYPALRDVFNIISSSLQPIFKNLGSTVSEDVAPFLDNLGAKVLPTLTDGLKMVTRWIKEATGFFKSLADAVKNFDLPDVLKPGSPPPFAIALSDIATSANQASLGIDKFQRLLSGVDTSSGEFLKTASKVMQASIEFTKSLKMGGVGNIAQMARNVFTQFTAQIVRTGEAGQLTAASLQTKLISYLQKYNKNVPATLDYFKQQGLTFEYLATQLNDSFGAFMKELRLQAITEDIGLAGRFASFGQAATERLNSEIETLQKVVNGEAEYYHNQVLTTVEAQELLNEKLAEQASVQKEINQLAQQQADLQFLQQQVDIIKLVEDRGLKAADIFKDVKFGLDASLPDLIKATSNVVQAMIDQINTDLQAGSPSKIMVNIGKMIDTSIGKGLIDNISAPIVAARKMVEGVVSVASGQVTGTGQGVSNIENNYFSMDVSTLASPQAVMAQYQVMRAMV